MNKVGILFHPLVTAAGRRAEELGNFLASRSVSVWMCSAWEREEARKQLNGTDLILSVGGDGTILRSAQAVAGLGIPITGINLGTLGFMTELTTAEAETQLPALLSGEGWIDERAMLQAEFATEGPAPEVFHALNDVVLARGNVARLVRIEAAIDGQRLTTYRADGVIVATATGSTSYSLAAGGSILYPHSRDFLVVPVAPHLGSICPLVVPERTTVELRISAAHGHPGTLSIDGHINLIVPDGATVTVRNSQHTTRFLRIHPDSFYGTLEKKLKGKQ
jgi:NAD+ kinase